MTVDEFRRFWESHGAEVTGSMHTADSCHYFVRSWELSKGHPSPFRELVRHSGINQPITMVFTRKEIGGLTWADLDEQYVARQLAVTFSAC
jgi:hypothetical protein